MRRKGHLTICRGAWCAQCHKQHDEDNFPVLMVSDLNDLIAEEELEVEEKERFKVARDGDHLMTPFQCDHCQFVNLRGKLPSDSEIDQRLLFFIRRAILDSFWSQESSTVMSNLYQIKSAKQQAISFGLEHFFLPPRGPFVVADDWGISHAVLILSKSLDLRRNSNQVQYQTVRKLRSTLSTFAHTCPGGLGPAFVNEDRTKSQSVLLSDQY